MTKSKEHDHNKAPGREPQHKQEGKTNDESSGFDATVSEEASMKPSSEESVAFGSEEATVAELEKKVHASNDRYLRLMAEFDNFKKRTSREYAQTIEMANEKIIMDLVDVRESFERALCHGETATEIKPFFDGIKLIFSKFDAILSAHGLVPFADQGDVFDPQIHDALMKIPHDKIPEDSIAEIFEKGYLLKDHVIKHARVVVSSGKGSSNSDVAAEA